MADIEISRLDGRDFRVHVRDGERETTHRVTVPDQLDDELDVVLEELKQEEEGHGRDDG